MLRQRSYSLGSLPTNVESNIHGSVQDAPSLETVRQRRNSLKGADSEGTPREVEYNNSDINPADSESQIKHQSGWESCAKTFDSEGAKVRSLKATSYCSESYEEDICFICMGGFTPRNPPIQIPCVEACNKAPIHAKCIYEWGERQKSGSSCPLCRSELGKIDYTPPDLLKSHQLVMFGCRKAFVTLPLPRKVGIVRCFITADKEMRNGFTTIVWRLYLQAPPKLRYPSGPKPDADSPKENDRLLLVARKRTGIKSQIDITLDERGKNFKHRDVHYVATLKSSWLGLEHTLIAPFRETTSRRRSTHNPHLQLAFIKYTQNRVGRAVGPRRMEISFPNVWRPGSRRSNGPLIYHDIAGSSLRAVDEADDSDDESSCDSQGPEEQRKWSTRVHRPANRTQTLRSLLYRGKDSLITDKSVIYASNVEPYWLEQIGAYSLDFQGRVTLPSNKNFQLVTGNNVNDIVLQFGKVYEHKTREIYTMDVQWPLSPLQAFGVCLSACDRKLACA